MKIKIALMAVVAAALLIGLACTAETDSQCPEGTDPFTEFNMYFGREKGDGSTVSEDEWRDFLADTVAPRFPDGFTSLDARGQWFDAENNRLYRESTKLLNVLAPSGAGDASAQAIREISDAYKERFDQQAVFLTTLPACAGLH